ncbi:tetraacyldisaccharide 4'-kinase [Colwellia psychrerythraea]|uniref:Tetraacyldisaccharide 4'-kinase n=1 Tax=Colwellia psychrerythraea (strain 34H / ATCC BAA-681) TaxID=167879 RepID=LPXK_COLP3|nr:tetraacyldisaccharide 4'-kinase [Colwellia psychrerythraea]Q483B5.1 RecName: Full=Tetraacyldisaccharide 4'-kinase; AltName: Full=Lipid A 4'-kinase [Colwellia psychrerythraea 34H]AAZ24412.1 tetraacyldisaccharide 4'-kinase [Colwellia psychrerythraea 34H]
MRLIEKVWFNDHPAKWLLVPMLLPLSALFWLISTLRRLSYKIGLSRSCQLSKPVIVVGNIGVGGNGKTPIVLYLVELTRLLGLTPGVISRGYGGKAPHYPYLLDEKSTSIEAGDEPILIQQRCQVPIAVGSDRIASAKLLIAQGCDIIISDDGLQHYRLARDLELVVVDGKRLFGNGLLLPAGPLREGLWRLPKSDLVIYNGKNDQDYQEKNYPCMHMTLAATELCNLLTGERIYLTDFIRLNDSVNAIAGIGAPQRFFDTLKEHQFKVINQQSFVDHHAFVLADFNEFDDNIPLLMTEKDAVKCHDFCKENWWYLPVDATFSDADRQLIIDRTQIAVQSVIQ